MIHTVKVRAFRVALQAAKADYGKHPSHMLADVLAYLRVKVRASAKPKPEYHQLPMFIVAGRPNGKYHCQRCGQHFGENRVSRLQSKRAYLTLHCPHCGASWYTDNSQ